MNRTLVIAEWKRAKFSLRAASSCLRDRCYADAVSRAYYAAFHAARAALSNLQDGHYLLQSELASSVIRMRCAVRPAR